MRLDKYIASTTDYSRDQAKKIISQKRVTVNEQVAFKTNTPVALTDSIFIDNKQLFAPAERYFMLNKPLGYICATSDPAHQCVTDLLNEPNKEKLKVVGRLDIDTTGLLFITTDGQWSHKITSPKYNCNKRYIAQLAHPIDDDMIEQLKLGVKLHDENELIAVKDAKKIDDTHIYLTISEGKYHQVKRMVAAISNRVVGLHRDKIGALALDTTLLAGEYRALTIEEISLFTK